MKIIIDDKIPYIKGVFEPYAEVAYLPGNQTHAGVVKDADALVTRTRTICNQDALKDSKVRFIATATIGFDHIDTRYCESAGIEWANAPGCNSESVNQYISAALLSWAKTNGFELKGKTIGIVGVGQVGSRVAKTCEILGMEVLLNDPPRERLEGSSQFSTLDSTQNQADVISFHVPLNREGIDKTFHMVDEPFLRNLKNKPLIINTCRGEVFATGDILKAHAAGEISGMVIDCWKNEPDIDLELLRRVDFGTPHIAGYSKDGKANGTQSSVRAISRFFNLGIDDWEPVGVEPPEKQNIQLNGLNKTGEAILAEAIGLTYAIAKDDQALREAPHMFERLRGDYPVRREFDCYSIDAINVKPDVIEKLRKLGFKL